MPKFQLSDDGTMDTVVACTECGKELRYSFHAQGGRDDDTQETYDEFIGWALADAEEDHECERED